MSPEIWSVLLVCSKLFIYLGIAGVVGGLACFLLVKTSDLHLVREPALVRWQISLCHYIICLAIAGSIANIANFFVQTGNMAESGFIGMIDPIMLEIMWSSSVGTVALIRSTLLVIFCLIAVYFLYMLSSTKMPISKRNIWMSIILSGIGFGYGFSLLGHTTEIAYGQSIFIILHALIGLLWVGALWPLYKVCLEFDDSSIHLIMQRFGRCAVWLVPLLFVVGVLMLVQIVTSIEELITSAYGRLFILKLTFVAFILSVAAWHKLVLVPRLLNVELGNRQLSSSIKIEMILGLLILLVTSIVTSVVGPAN